jgi:hypothetical protein
MEISKETIMMQPNQVLKHKHVDRYILIIAVNKLKI